MSETPSHTVLINHFKLSNHRSYNQLYHLFDLLPNIAKLPHNAIDTIL